MATTVNRLTDRGVRGQKPKGAYLDGDGLYLVVSRTGARSWIYRYRCHGRRREIGLGSFQDVGLADARAARDQANKTVAAGGDPAVRRPSRSEAGGPPELSALSGTSASPHRKAVPTLHDCWTAYVAGQEGGWRGRKTKEGWLRSIDRHAAAIKDWPVDRIDVGSVLSVLQPLWLTKSESAGKLRERLERVLDYAKVRGFRTGENPARWQGNLVHLLPPRPKLQRGHMPAMPYQDIPDFMVRLAKSQGMSARALEFTILTVARETMTLEATWGEMGPDLWTLDVSRMKERPFRQPLSKGALQVLGAVRPAKVGANQLVFPSRVGGVMSNMSMDMLLRDLAPGFTPHGMRSTFRDWAGDETDYAREVIEECLAHVVGDDTERAYRRGDALRKRRAVLEAWSVFCLSMRDSKSAHSDNRTAASGRIDAEGAFLLSDAPGATADLFSAGRP